MDNYSGMNGVGFSYGFGLGLFDNLNAHDLVENLDKNVREEVMKHYNEFQSKEELERFIYHLNNDQKLI